MASQSRTISDNISLSDTYEQVWETTPILEETITLDDGDAILSPDKILEETIKLSDPYSRTWITSKELIDTITLDDGGGDDQFSQYVKLTDIEVSDEGSYISITSKHAEPDKALKNLINEMEIQSCPASQTTMLFAYDSGNSIFVASAVVKRH
jgi:hypothetical protein